MNKKVALETSREGGGETGHLVMRRAGFSSGTSAALEAASDCVWLIAVAAGDSELL